MVIGALEFMVIISSNYVNNLTYESNTPDLLQIILSTLVTTISAFTSLET